jgi:hypothetical protein
MSDAGEAAASKIVQSFEAKDGLFTKEMPVREIEKISRGNEQS